VPEIRFDFAEVFPADDDLSRWVMSLSIALGDLRTAARYATRDEQPDHERVYFIRQFASHMRELVKVMELGPQRSEALRAFVDETLSDEGRRAYGTALDLIRRPLALRPGVTMFDERHAPRRDGRRGSARRGRLPPRRRRQHAG
jgi:hypothetical protein